MKKEIADFIKKVIYYILGLTVLFFIILKCYLSTINDNDYVKDTISNTIAFLSAISTIGAAVIASRLFSDWRVQSSLEAERDAAKDLLLILIELRIHAEAYYKKAIQNNVLHKSPSKEKCDYTISESKKNLDVIQKNFLIKYDLYYKVYANQNDDWPQLTESDIDKFNLFNFLYVTNRLIKAPYSKDNINQRVLLDTIEDTRKYFLEKTDYFIEKLKDSIKLKEGIK